MIFKPVFFEFPKSFKQNDNYEQFMIGEELLAAPCLYHGDDNTNSTTYKIELPQNEEWFNFYNGEFVQKTSFSQVLSRF